MFVSLFKGNPVCAFYIIINLFPEFGSSERKSFLRKTFVHARQKVNCFFSGSCIVMMNLINLHERIMKYFRHISFTQLKHEFAKFKIVYVMKF